MINTKSTAETSDFIHEAKRNALTPERAKVKGFWALTVPYDTQSKKEREAMEKELKQQNGPEREAVLVMIKDRSGRAGYEIWVRLK